MRRFLVLILVAVLAACDAALVGPSGAPSSTDPLDGLEVQLSELDGRLLTIGKELSVADSDVTARVDELQAELAVLSSLSQQLQEFAVADPDLLAEEQALHDVDEQLAHVEEQLQSIGDDSQLANVDLQAMLQKQQQVLQMMSNISKVLHDTSTAIIRKIGG